MIFLDNLAGGIGEKELDHVGQNTSSLARLCYVAIELRDLTATNIISKSEKQSSEAEDPRVEYLQHAVWTFKDSLSEAAKNLGSASENNLDRIVNTILSGVSGLRLAGQMYASLAQLVEACPENEVTRRDVCYSLLNSLSVLYNESAETIFGLVKRYGLTTKVVNLNLKIATNAGPEMPRLKIRHVLENDSGDLSEKTKNELKKISSMRLKRVG